MKICKFTSFHRFSFRAARASLLKIHIKSSDVQLTEEELQAFAQQTEGYSGSDLSNLILSALFEPIRDMQKADRWLKMAGKALGLPLTLFSKPLEAHLLSDQ